MIRRIHYTWECSLCGSEYVEKSRAAACEQSGIVAPRFTLGQRVNAMFGQFDKRPGTVCQVLNESLYPYVHDGILVYVVCLDRKFGDGYLVPFDARDLDPEGTKPENVPDWRTFWRVFTAGKAGGDDVRKHLKARNIPLSIINKLGSPKF